MIEESFKHFILFGAYKKSDKVDFFPRFLPTVWTCFPGRELMFRVRALTFLSLNESLLTFCSTKIGFLGQFLTPTFGVKLHLGRRMG